MILGPAWWAALIFSELEARNAWGNDRGSPEQLGWLALESAAIGAIGGLLVGSMIEKIAAGGPKLRLVLVLVGVALLAFIARA